MAKRQPLVLFALIILAACTSELTDPQKIIDRSINVHGGKKFENSTIEFDFRNRHYVAFRNRGMFSYERIFKEGDNTVHDFLTNDGFHREINNTPIHVIDTMAAKYTRSVNSTIYFASLPYALNDAAVKKKFLGTTTMDGEPYYKVEITFEQNDGGEDHDDVFHYWIHKERFTMDYFAYVYFSEGGGIRFRKAIRQHRVGGILLQDYTNYKPAEKSIPIDSMEQLYKRNALEKLSDIELTNVSVR